MQTSTYLKTALEAVKRAESVIMDYFRKDDIEFELKQEDMSPVTIADKKGEQIIREVIAAQFPEHGFLGEEYGEQSAEYTWVIDPIDGTKSYMRGMPFWGTLLALVKDDEPIVGIINQPALDELYTAEKGRGTILNGKPVRVSKLDKLKDAYLSTGSLYRFEDVSMLEGLLDISHAIKQNSAYRDCWQYTLLAQGYIDIVIEAGQKGIWDCIAPKIIVEEAGGKLTSRAGQPIGSDREITVVATNTLLHDQVLEYFKEDKNE